METVDVNQKKWYQLAKVDALKELKTTKEGLATAEAKDRLSQFGLNELTEGKRQTVIEVFLHQFKDFLVIILCVAAVISLLSGNVESTVVIFAVIILNALLGTIQHVKAEKSLASLKSLSSPNAKVMRDGVKIEINSKEVVPGDILLLEAGDMVVADARILENYSLQVNESSLTGESTNVEKADVQFQEELPLADRVNMVFSGSMVTYGRATALVIGTGMDTEIGKIAKLMNDTKEKKTPLQISLDKFSSKLAMVIMIICVLIFGLSIYRKMEVLDSLMFAVALAVAAIPEALASIVTIVQAIGTQKMAKENVIIKDLKAVESLGCVSVICSDKTGTLTQNKMEVKQIYIGENTIKAEELNVENQLHRYLLYNAILTNDSSIVEGKGIGDPTEYALLEMAAKTKIDYSVIRSMMVRKEEIPFDSDRKLMSTKYALHGKETVLTKGALDILLDRTNSIRTENGVRAIEAEDKRIIFEKNREFSESGLRVLSFAYKEMEADESLTLENESGFTFIGLVAMMDPPRVESMQAVSDAKRAGIKPVMITGDHKITATAIAKQIGIYEEGDIALIGTELDQMSDDELDDNIESISVYARVSPENKIRIVQSWQRKGHIVSMTGDGVNDAPALKKADIGVAMGITGTEVSKDAASMILLDDNFASIIKAVSNGRSIYNNIKNAILFLLSGNMAGILAVLYTTVLALPLPFQPVHLLFINLLTDSLPAIAIGMEPAEPGLLNLKPRNPKEQILNKEILLRIFVQGGLIAFVSIIAFYIGNEKGAALASTMAFVTLTLARLFHGFNCRSKHSIFKIGFKKNWYSLAAFFAGVFLLSFVVFVPFMHNLFEIESLTLSQFALLTGLAAIPTVLIQGVKIVRGFLTR